jgi:endonuclease-8
MAEGPVAHYYAGQLAKVLAGKPVEIELRSRKLNVDELSLRGLSVTDVEARGKLVLIHLSDGRIILVHLMMWGSWRIYRRGAEWEKPSQRARLVLRTDAHEAVAFSAPIVRVLTREELKADPKWMALGPDPLRSDFSEEESLRRLEAHADEEVGEALLNQQVIAGIGNILRNEILFRAGVHPRRKISSLSDIERRAVLRLCVELCRLWLRDMGSEKRNAWLRIYRKSGRPCPRCGARVEFFRQAGRVTYACPACQREKPS